MAYDYEYGPEVEAWSIDPGDLILFINDEGAEDPIEVISVVDETDSILVHGYSHLTGENTTYIWEADAKVLTWYI